jgi:hypothetical protein
MTSPVRCADEVTRGFALPGRSLNPLDPCVDLRAHAGDRN